MQKRGWLRCVLLAGWTFLLAVPSGARALTYLSEQEALALAFGEDAAVEHRTLELSEEGAARYAEAVGVQTEAGANYDVHIGTKDGKVTGYAFILTESSRYRPITFLVAITPDFAVQRVDIMVYREPRGGDVKKRRFLEQYESKEESMRLGRDILSISGATVSAQVVTFGVNKALFLAREFFGAAAGTGIAKKENTK